MNEREYARIRKQIEGEYRDKLSALDLVWEMAGTTSVRPKRRGASGDASSLARIVKEATRSMTEVFTIREIESSVKNIDPQIGADARRTSLSVILNRLAAANEISIVEPGKGRRATTYRNPESKPAGPVQGTGNRRDNQAVSAASQLGAE